MINATIPVLIQGQVELYEHQIISSVCDALPQKIVVFSSALLIIYCLLSLLQTTKMIQTKEKYRYKIIENINNISYMVMLGCILALTLFSTLNANGNVTILGWTSIGTFVVVSIIEGTYTI